jgi:hypothetical protein
VAGEVWRHASLIGQMQAMEEVNLRLKRMYADLGMQADLLVGLTDARKTWGLGLCARTPAQREGAFVEPQTRLPISTGPLSRLSVSYFSAGFIPVDTYHFETQLTAHVSEPGDFTNSGEMIVQQMCTSDARWMRSSCSSLTTSTGFTP